MTKNLFFYTRVVKVNQEDIEGNPLGNKEERYTDAFNINKVIRAISYSDTHMLVLLDDIHQRKEPVEIKNKRGEVTGVKNELGTFQSEVHLVIPEDIERFKKLSID